MAPRRLHAMLGSAPIVGQRHETTAVMRQIAICGVIAAALAFAGCGSSSSPPAAAPGPTAPPTKSTTTTSLTASQVVSKLKADGLPVTRVVVFTTATDPNHLLGRPNGYTSKASWVDSRIPTGQATSVAAGGSVEVYPTASGAEARAKYIATIAAKATFLNEYDYVNGDELLRLSATLTPTQAQGYAKVIGATLVTVG